MGLLNASNEFSQKLKISYNDSKLLSTSSLVYYLGSMPYNTAFYNFIDSKLNCKIDNYQDTSIKVFKELALSDNFLNFFDENEISLIENIVKGNTSSMRQDNMYLASILNNKDYHVDLVKMNDIERDSKYFGNQDGYDCQVPLSDVKIINGKLYFNYKVI
jgi:hypothetical protein